ncbi:olfactory receptor 1K1-like [Alligator mississippiensis]|nr:olfactory receptor 1K1-like [Alligator mississippiensis]
MEQTNASSLPGFILLGFSSHPELRRLLFPLFLTMYTLTLLGNSLMVLLARTDPRLRCAPMYILLGHLSIVDVAFSSTTVPRALMDLLWGNRAVSYVGCLAQTYFFVAFGITDSFLLACMAFDRYVAVCHPLRYATVMGPSCCLGLVAGSWAVSHLHSLLHVGLLARLSFCASREIPHYFCDVQPLLRLSCSSTRVNELVAFTESSVIVMGPFLFILGSYIFILTAVLRLPSGEGRRKAMSTCGSHLAVVALFYGTVIAVYIRPASSYSADQGRVVTVVYTALTPMLNPLIYSLRNQEVAGALRRALDKLQAPGR